MSGGAETPLEAARRYVREQEAKIVQQRLLILRLAAKRRSTVSAELNLAGMEHSLILLLGRVARLAGVGPDDGHRLKAKRSTGP